MLFIYSVKKGYYLLVLHLEFLARVAGFPSSTIASFHTITLSVSCLRWEYVVSHRTETTRPTATNAGSCLLLPATPTTSYLLFE